MQLYDLEKDMNAKIPEKNYKRYYIILVIQFRMNLYANEILHI